MPRVSRVRYVTNQSKQFRQRNSNRTRKRTSITLTLILTADTGRHMYIECSNADIVAVPTRKPSLEIAPTTLADREFSGCCYLFTVSYSGLIFTDVCQSQPAFRHSWFSKLHFHFQPKKERSFSCDLKLWSWPSNLI